jgi:hypothetical protein
MPHAIFSHASLAIKQSLLTLYSSVNRNWCFNILNFEYSLPWPEFASELYRPSLLAKLVPTFADKGCRMVSATDPYGRILGFIDRKMFNVLNSKMKFNMLKYQLRLTEP